MADRTLEERVEVIERQLGNKTLEEHFRVQGEMLDVRFLLVDERFTSVDARFSGIDRQLEAITKELAVVRHGVEILLKRLT